MTSSLSTGKDQLISEAQNEVSHVLADVKSAVVVPRSGVFPEGSRVTICASRSGRQIHKSATPRNQEQILFVISLQNGGSRTDLDFFGKVT